MYLIVANTEKGARSKTASRVFYKKLISSLKEGTTLLEFIYCQLYNCKIAQRYGYTPTDERPICHKPDSYTHIAGELPAHEALDIRRHNAACQWVHAAIRKTAKGGGALHKASELTMVVADTSNQPQTPDETLVILSPTTDEACPSPLVTDPSPD
jgi:hypothetical protein